MQLVDLVHRETAVDHSQIMVLRHSNPNIEQLFQSGGSVEEFTSVQPTGTKYDFWADTPRVKVVVVIVDDHVFGIYRVDGVLTEGTTSTVGSPAHLQFQKLRMKPEMPHRHFQLTRLPCTAENAEITGWKGKEIQPVLRNTGNLYRNIEVNPADFSPIGIEDHDLTDVEIDVAIREKRLRFGVVPTSSTESVVRQRRGQRVLRKLTLEAYGDRCAICDIKDDRLLRASHIIGWAEREETRGDLGNVICLCSFHDSLFESGYWSLDDQLRPVIRTDIVSETIQVMLPADCSFRRPSMYPPESEFVEYHRTKHGL